MTEAIIIEQLENNRRRQIRVFVPMHETGDCRASIQDKQGAVLNRFSLKPGENKIDITLIHEKTISLKVETPFVTILKEIKPPL